MFSTTTYWSIQQESNLNRFKARALPLPLRHELEGAKCNICVSVTYDPWLSNDLRIFPLRYESRIHSFFLVSHECTAFDLINSFDTKH